MKAIVKTISLLLCAAFLVACAKEPEADKPKVTKYTITYNANGATAGSVPSDSRKYIKDQKAIIFGNTGNLAKTGNVFLGWCESANGSGEIYTAQYEVTIKASIILYAVWSPELSVTYDGNGATSGTPPSDLAKYAAGQTLTLMGNTGSLAKTGFIFNGWTTVKDSDVDVLSPGSSWKIAGATVFYAHWISNSTTTYTVTYSANDKTGGSVPTDPNVYVSGQQATVLGNTGSLVKTGSVFDSWNTLQNGTGTRYVAGGKITVTGNVTLFAQWVETRVFKAIKPLDNTWYDVTATKLAVGTHSLVYAENASGVASATAQAIASEFDANIYQKIVDNFGTPLDVDGNGKTIILLLDVKDGYAGSGGYIAGFFHSAHMYSKSTFANSNEADMLFMDTYPQTAGSTAFYGTVAHEFQHLINYSMTVPVDGTPQDTWVNEGLSSGAEYVYSGAVNQSRVNWFNADSLETMRYGNNFFVWDGYWESYDPNAVLDNYATVNLFFQWLRIHASNGTGIYKDILASSYRDYRAVTAAASSKISAGFTSWETLLGTWLSANLLCRPSGYYGYKNNITTAPKCFNSSSAEAYLSPGEAVYSYMPGVTSVSSTATSYTPPAGGGANIRYLGINGSTYAIDSSAPYDGHVSLVFNANSDNTALDETGFIATVANRSFALLDQYVPIEAQPSSWAIDLQFAPDGGVSDATKNALNKVRGKRISREAWARDYK